MFGRDIGIDLGTANTLIYLKGKGIIVREPSVVALNKSTGTVVAVGTEAKRMLGRTPEDIIATSPMKEGVIADFDITENMLSFLIKKVCGSSIFFKPVVIVCIPVGVTGVEERAIKQAVEEAGAREVYLITEPIAAAIGASIDITLPCGNMIVDIGGGTTDIAVISLSGIVVCKALRVGGNKFDEAIIRAMRKNYNIMIGESTAEEIKINIGAAISTGESKKMDVRGKDMVKGLPVHVSVGTEEIILALRDYMYQIVAGIKQVLENTPPELASDIISRGIYLTGGGALLQGLDQLINRETGLTVKIAENPKDCVANGMGKLLEYEGKYGDINTRESILMSRYNNRTLELN